MATEPVPIRFVRLDPAAKEPERGSAMAAGWDIHALRSVEIRKGRSERIPTGIALAIPAGYEGQVRARSSLGAKGLLMPNGIGTIDADYRGEIQVLATWIGEGHSYTVEAGERIAQLVIAPVPKVEFIEVEANALGDTERGGGGFGSTGRF